MDSVTILDQLAKLVAPDQINQNEEDLYEASADRYKKYAKARKVLDVPAPIAIVYPDNAEQVSVLLKFCNDNGINVIPRSGMTATEGGLENWKETTLVVDTVRLDKIIKIDPYNSQATVEAGVALQTLEDELRKIGYTTGHSPQSKPVAKYEVWLPPVQSVSSLPSMVALKIWLSGSNACFPMVTSLVSRMFPAGWRTGYSAYCHRQRRGALLYHRSDGEDLQILSGQQQILWLPG